MFPTCHVPLAGEPLKTNSIPSLIFDVTFVILLEKAGINIFIILFNRWIVCETPKKTRLELQSPKWSGLSNLPPRIQPTSSQSHKSIEMKAKTTQQLHNDYVNIYVHSKRAGSLNRKEAKFVTMLLALLPCLLLHLPSSTSFLNTHFTHNAFIHSLWTSLFSRDPKTCFFF